MSKLPLEGVERELARLWEEESKRSQASRMALLTLVALVSEARLAERAAAVLDHVARIHPCRTISVLWPDGAPPGILADVSLHRSVEGAPGALEGRACGDAIVLEARGAARDWIPENIDRLLLSDLPVCLWWVGDLPDFDDLFDRMVKSADVVVVNSGEMDLRDLEKLSKIADGGQGLYALADLTWVRLKALQELVARFFDEPHMVKHLDELVRITIAYSPRPDEKDVTSTQAGLFLGWLAAALELRPEATSWKRDDDGGEVTLVRRGTGRRLVTVRFDRDKRANVPDGALTLIDLRCDGVHGQASFTLARQDDPLLFRWTCDAPDWATPSQVLSISEKGESTLLVRYLEHPAADPLLEASLRAGSAIVRPVAPRLSVQVRMPKPLRQRR